VLAVWAQQDDALTLAPVAGRNYEPASLSAGESASVMEYLMSLQHPSPAVVRSVDAAAAWFEAHKVMGYTWSGGRDTPGGRKLAASPGAGPLWARYYSIATGLPVFGDRDKTIHDDVMDLSLERRNGYGWYGVAPKRALEQYAAWKAQNH
jgi:PelA/Pel-15E family pectate lyase